MNFKRTILTAVVAIAMIGVTNATNKMLEKADANVITNIQDSNDIEVSDLPQKAQDFIKDNEYEVQKASEIMVDNETAYAVEVLSGEVKLTLLFDKEGNIIEG